MLKRLIRFTAVAAAVVGMVAIAMPAHADPPALPAGESLFTFSCPSDPGLFYTYSVDSATAASTAIGAGTLGYCSYDPEWDSVTQTAYAIIETRVGSNFVYHISTVDLLTGVVSLGPLITSDGTKTIDAGALAIGLGGQAYMNYNDSLFSLDLTTGIATSLGTLPNVGHGGSWGFSVDPATGLYYLLNADGNFFLVDPATVSATLQGTFPFPSGVSDTYGLSIDSNSTAWIVSYENDPGTASLYSASVADITTIEYSGPLHDATTGDPFYSFTALIAPTPVAAVPALASTGFEATPWIETGAALALVGFALLLTARVRRSAAASRSA